MKVINVFCIYLGVLIYQAPVKMGAASDCWNPDRLAKMKFDLSPGEQRDPNLAQFSNLVKCLEQEQGRKSNVGNMDWRQWQNVVKSNDQSNDLNNVWNRQTTAPWMRPGNQRPPNQGPGYNQNPGYNNNPGVQQPRPGVHPDDYNNRQPGSGPSYAGNNVNWPQNQQNPDGARNRDRDREQTRNDRRRNRNKNRRKDPNNVRSPNNEITNNDKPGTPYTDGTIFDNANKVGRDGSGKLWSDQNANGMGGPGAQQGTDAILIQDNETKQNRMYGYIIMASSVVVLAVLMVFTIFCCNSSNSTMSQPATQAIPAGADSYSIYSYTNPKGGSIDIGSDTMRTGTIGLGDTLRTQTMQSHGRGPSPQYRVSDIDPDFARRFQQDQHQPHY